MKTADLINEIINGIERLVMNIKKLYSNIRISFRTNKNVTI